MQEMKPRMKRGFEIVQKGTKILEVADNVFSIPSQSTNENYLVINAEEKWICTCPDHKYRQVVCKHIHAVRFWLALNCKLEKKVQTVLVECKWCGSKSVIKYYEKNLYRRLLS